MSKGALRYELRRRFRNYFKNRDYQKALKVGEELADMHKDKEEPEDWRYFDDLYNLGLVRQKLGQFNEAMTYYFNSYSQNIESFGENYGLIYPLNNMAVIYANNGAYEKALEMYIELIGILKNLGRRNTKDYYDTLYNLANIYTEMERYEDAAQLHKEVCNYYEHDNSIAAADAFSNTAYVMEVLERYEEAQQYMKKAVFILKRNGVNDIELSKNIFYLANLLQKDRKYMEALKYYSELLNIFRRSGKKVPYYPTCLNRIACILEKQGRIKEALRLRNDALAQMRDVIGGRHLSYAVGLREAADLYKSIKDYENAIEFLSDSLDIRKRLCGYEEHVLRDMSQLVELYALAERSEEAVELIVEMLKILSETSEDVDSIIKDLAKVYIQIGDINTLNEIYNAITLD